MPSHRRESARVATDAATAVARVARRAATSDASARPEPARAQAVRALQRQIGNGATARLLGVAPEPGPAAGSQSVEQHRTFLSSTTSRVADTARRPSPGQDVAALARPAGRAQSSLESASSTRRNTVTPAQRTAPIAQRVDAAGQLVLDAAGLTLAALSLQAQAIDKGALTRAGRAAAKHSVRAGSVFGPELKGNDGVKNAAGLAHVDEILNSGASTVLRQVAGRFGEVLDIQIPGGKGVRFAIDGTMIGFLEP